MIAIGCGQAQVSQTSAYVSSSQAKRAAVILDSIDYLPFDYKADGCYARALYVSMELAIQGIPSSAQYEVGNFYPEEGVAWIFHVATLIHDLESNQALVLDPSIDEQSKVWHYKDWVAKLKHRGLDFINRTSVVQHGNSYGFNAYDPPQEVVMVNSVDEMPAFNESDVISACRVAHLYLTTEHELIKSGKDQLQYKQAKLNRRTARILISLDERKKLSRNRPGWLRSFPKVNETESFDCRIN